MTDTPPIITEKKRPLWLRFRFVIPAMLVVLLLMSPAAYRHYYLSLVPVIEEPFDTTILENLDIPPEENALSEYKLAIDKWVKRPHTLTDAELDRVATEGWNSASTNVKKWVKENEEAFNLWKKGTEKLHFLYMNPHNLKADRYLKYLEDIQELKTIVRHVSLLGERLESEEKYSEAREWYQAIFRFSRHTGKYGTMIEREVLSLFSHKVASYLIIRWAENPAVTSEQIEQARIELEQDYLMTVSASTTFINNFYLAQDYLVSLSRDSEDYRFILKNPLRLKLHKLFGIEPKFSVRVHPHFVKNIISQVDLPLYLRKQRTVGRTKLYDNGSANSPSLDKLAYTMNQTTCLNLCLPYYYHFIEEVDREKTRQGILIVTLAAQQYKRDHGVFPPDSAALIKGNYLKEMPLDAMQDTKIEIQYRHTAKQTVIYSLGYDGIDNDGSVEYVDRPGYLFDFEADDYGYVLETRK